MWANILMVSFASLIQIVNFFQLNQSWSQIQMNKISRTSGYKNSNLSTIWTHSLLILHNTSEPPGAEYIFGKQSFDYWYIWFWVLLNLFKHIVNKNFDFQIEQVHTLFYVFRVFYVTTLQNSCHSNQYIDILLKIT